MRLDLATWQEVDEYLKNSDGVIIPAGSTEQHGPMGLIGTDALCAEQIATLEKKVKTAENQVPRTVSVDREVIKEVVKEVEVIKEVPVEKIVDREVIKEVVKEVRCVC